MSTVSGSTTKKTFGGNLGGGGFYPVENAPKGDIPKSSIDALINDAYGSGNWGRGSSGGGIGTGRSSDAKIIADQVARDMKDAGMVKGVQTLIDRNPGLVRLSLTPVTDVGLVMTKDQQKRAASEVTFGGALTNLSTEEKANLIAIANAPSTRTQKEIEDSIPDTIYKQIKYVDKLKDQIPEDVQKKVYNTVLTASIIGVDKFPSIREVFPQIDTLAKMISDSPEQLKAMSIQQISEAITKHVTDSALIGSMIPDFIKTLQEGSNYKLHIQNVETLLETQEIPDRIKASITEKKIKLTQEEIIYASETLPDTGIMLITGKMTVEEFREIKDGLENIANYKSPYEVNQPVQYKEMYKQMAKKLTKAGLPLELLNAAINDAKAHETTAAQEWIDTELSSDEFQLEVEEECNNAGVPGKIAEWYRDPDHRVLSTMGGIGLGAVGGFLSGGPVGAIVGGTMGVFAGTELPQSLDSLIYADSTMEKLKNQGLGDNASKIRDWKQRATDHWKNYNEAVKSGDIVAANEELKELRAVENERASWVEKNWDKLYLAGIYQDEVSKIAKNKEQIDGRILYEGTMPDGIKAFSIPRYQAGQDHVVIYPKSDPTKKYDLGTETAGTLRMPPGEWVVEITKYGEQPQQYNYNVSGKGGMSTAPLSDEQKTKFTTETAQAVATYDVLKTSDVERQAMYDKGVRINVNTPPGWEVWDIEEQKWVDRDYVIVHSEGQKYVRARPKGSNESPYWTSLRTDNPAGVFQADIDQFSPRVASKDAQGGASQAQGHVLFDGWMDGSAIYIDGKLAANPERLTGFMDIPGEHTVTIETPGYERETKQVYIKSGEATHVSLVPTNPLPSTWKTKSDLSKYGPGMGALELKGFKQTDVILVDGERLLPELIEPELLAEPGDYVFEIQREGFETEYKTVRVAVGEKTVASLSPTKAIQKPWTTKADASIYGPGMGAMALSGFKPDDIIMVNGERLFPDLIEPELTAEPGDYVFEIQRAGFQPEYKTVRITAGEKTVASLQPTKPVEEQYKTQFELSQYGVGKGLLKFTGYKPGDSITLDGKPFIGEGAPEDTKVDQGVHTVVINRAGFEPEYQEITVKAGEFQNVSLVPTKTPYVKTSYGGGGGSYGGGSGGSSVGQKEIAPTVVTVGPNVAGCYLAINKVEKKFTVGTPFNYPFGAWIVKIIKPDGKMFEQAMIFSADGSLYINPADSAFTRTATFPGASGAGGGTVTPATTSDVFFISLTTEPEGAKVLINNSFTGDWTPAKVPLAKGYYTLALYKSGYAKFETGLWVDNTMLLGEAAEQKARQEGY